MQDSSSGAAEVDWSAFQQELDGAFHRKEDQVVAGSTEHAELLTFIPKLHKLKQSRSVGQAAGLQVHTGTSPTLPLGAPTRPPC